METISPEKIVRLELLDEVHALAMECMALGCLGVLDGPPGVGKTIALQSVEKRLNISGHPSRSLYVRAYPSQGPTRSVRDLLESVGVRTHIMSQGVALQTLARMALKEFASRGIELLLVDEADNWSIEGLQGFVTMLDVSRQQGRFVSAILCGNSDMTKWVGQYAAGISRTLRAVNAQSLEVTTMLGVLAEWGEGFAQLVTQIRAGDKSARSLGNAIHKLTRGNLRRLHFYARLHVMHFGDEIVTEPSHQTVTTKLLAS